MGKSDKELMGEMASGQQVAETSEAAGAPEASEQGEQAATEAESV